MKLKNILLYSVASLLLAGCSKSNTSKMDIFIDQLMDEMTVKEKIGQLNLNVSGGFVAGEGINGNTVPLEQRIENGEIGGLFGLKNVEVIKHWQQVAVEKSRLHIPLLFGMDVIHGYDVTFPIPLALASSWNPDMIEQVARTSAIEASSDGVNWVFSPMVDVCHDARWGRIAESAGEDPYLGGEIAKAWVRGYQTNNLLDAPDNVMACVKHYALYGAVEGGRDYNIVNMGRQEALNGFLPPYRESAYEGAGSFMASFNDFEGIPAHINRYLLNDLLREEWGFKGFITSDYEGINECVNHGIGDIEEVTALAIEASVDMDLNGSAYMDNLENLVKQGRLSEKDIEVACRRVLEAKYKLGLFANPYKYCDVKRAEKEVFTPEHRSIARQIATETFVLLKNQDNLLPLQRKGNIALIGPLANTRANMPGTWSVAATADKYSTLLEGFKNSVGSKANILYAQGSNLMYDADYQTRATMFGRELPRGNDQELLDEALKVAAQADVIVAALGESSEMSGESSSRSELEMPDAQRHLLEALLKTGKPVVLVLFSGRPVVLTWENENVPAILNVWFGGSEAAYAIGDVLFGGDARMLAGLHGILLGRQAEGVVAHGVQHVLALHAVVAADHIGGEVAQRVADVQALAGRVREHVHREVGRAAFCVMALAVLQVAVDVGGPEGAFVIPDLLPFLFDALRQLRVVAERRFGGFVRLRLRAFLSVTHSA